MPWLPALAWSLFSFTAHLVKTGQPRQWFENLFTGFVQRVSLEQRS